MEQKLMIFILSWKPNLSYFFISIWSNFFWWEENNKDEPLILISN